MLPQVLSVAPSRSQGHTVRRIFRTCPASNVCSVSRDSPSADPFPHFPLDVRRFHYRSANKKSPSTRGLEPSNMMRRLYPALRNDRPVYVDVLCEDFLCGREVQLESRQIAVVDTVEVRSESPEAVKLASAVHLNQDLQSKPISFKNHTIKPNIGQFPAEDLGNQDHRTGSCPPSSLELFRRHYDVFHYRRHLYFLSDCDQSV